MPLPEDQEERKKIPLYTGLVKYFPDFNTVFSAAALYEK